MIFLLDSDGARPHETAGGLSVTADGFGSAAWKCAARDAWIGWDRGTRERNLQGLTNPSADGRFLVLPWVTVPRWDAMARSSVLLANVAPWLISSATHQEMSSLTLAGRQCVVKRYGEVSPLRLP